MLYWLEQNLLSCFFKTNFGIECPGCGMQRALLSILNGNITQSLYYNAALLPLVITFIALVVQLKIKHQHGAFYVLILFALTCIVMIAQFTYKQFLFFH